MENVTSEQIDTLVEFQKKETEIAGIKVFLNNSPEKLDVFDEKINEFQQALEEKELDFKKMKKKYRENESDVQVNLEKIKKKDIQLMSIKSNKDYQALLTAIEDLKTQNSGLEDEMIEFLDVLDDNEAALSKERAEFSLIKDQILTEKNELEQKCENERKKLSDLNSDLNKISEKVAPDLMKRYNSIREKIKGVAIAAAKNSVCQACYINIPPQMYNELYKSDTLNFCPNCQRIIYVKNES